MPDPKDKSKDKKKPLRTYKDPVNVETYTTGGDAYNITVEKGSNYAKKGTMGGLRPVGPFNKRQDDPMWQGYTSHPKKINMAGFKMKN